MAVSEKEPVGTNSSFVWNYGGEQVGFADPIECPLAPMGPHWRMGPMEPLGRPLAAGAGRPAGRRTAYFVVVRKRTRLTRTLPSIVLSL